MLVVLIGFGIASFLAIGRGADFPGAEILRTAGKQGKDIFQQANQSPSGEPTAGEAQQAPSPATAPQPSSNLPSTSQAATQTTPTPRPLLQPDQKHLEYKEYMLELINKERERAGVPPVTLGKNIAAQLHAEASLENCISGHWGVDGLKPYMRYTLAGGYQTNSENASGLRYCIKPVDQIAPIGTIREEIREAMDGWMNSPDHRRALLDKWRRKVNVGLAWDRYNFHAVQHFESDYVAFDKLPEITNGTVVISGRATNGAQYHSKEQLRLQIYYDPPPRPLTVGQVTRTYCYDSGIQVAGFRYPLTNIDLTEFGLSDVNLNDVSVNEVSLSDVSLTDASIWAENEFTTTYSPCRDPYDQPPESPAPSSYEEARRFWEEAYSASLGKQDQAIAVPWITASKWTALGTNFSVTGNISKLLSKHGPGVYTILLWGYVDGEKAAISQYSIFHQVNPPDTYNPERWK